MAPPLEVSAPERDTISQSQRGNPTIAASINATHATCAVATKYPDPVKYPDPASTEKKASTVFFCRTCEHLRDYGDVGNHHKKSSTKEGRRAGTTCCIVKPADSDPTSEGHQRIATHRKYSSIDKRPVKAELPLRNLRLTAELVEKDFRVQEVALVKHKSGCQYCAMILRGMKVAHPKWMFSSYEADGDDAAVGAPGVLTLPDSDDEPIATSTKKSDAIGNGQSRAAQPAPSEELLKGQHIVLINDRISDQDHAVSPSTAGPSLTPSLVSPSVLSSAPLTQSGPGPQSFAPMTKVKLLSLPVESNIPPEHAGQVFTVLPGGGKGVVMLALAGWSYSAPASHLIDSVKAVPTVRRSYFSLNQAEPPLNDDTQAGYTALREQQSQEAKVGTDGPGPMEQQSRPLQLVSTDDQLLDQLLLDATINASLVQSELEEQGDAISEAELQATLLRSLEPTETSDDSDSDDLGMKKKRPLFAVFNNRKRRSPLGDDVNGTKVRYRKIAAQALQRLTDAAFGTERLVNCFDVDDTPADGDCFYHCCRLLLLMMSAADIRNAVADHMAHNPAAFSEYGAFVYDNEGYSDDWSKNLQAADDMRRQQRLAVYIAGVRAKEWADHPAMQAFSNRFNITVVVFSSQGNGHTHVMKPFWTETQRREQYPSERLPARQMFVLHVNSNHYIGLTLKQGVAPLIEDEEDLFLDEAFMGETSPTSSKTWLTARTPPPEPSHHALPLPLPRKTFDGATYAISFNTMVPGTTRPKVLTDMFNSFKAQFVDDNPYHGDVVGSLCRLMVGVPSVDTYDREGYTSPLISAVRKMTAPSAAAGSAVLQNAPPSPAESGFLSNHFVNVYFKFLSNVHSEMRGNRERTLVFVNSLTLSARGSAGGQQGTRDPLRELKKKMMNGNATAASATHASETVQQSGNLFEKFDIRSSDIWTVVPVNLAEHQHWGLALVSFKHRACVMVDSMGYPRDAWERKLQRWYKNIGLPAKDRPVTVHRSPWRGTWYSQVSSNDCADSICKTATAIVLGKVDGLFQASASVWRTFALDLWQEYEKRTKLVTRDAKRPAAASSALTPTAASSSSSTAGEPGKRRSSRRATYTVAVVDEGGQKGCKIVNAGETILEGTLLWRMEHPVMINNAGEIKRMDAEVEACCGQHGWFTLGINLDGNGNGNGSLVHAHDMKYDTFLGTKTTRHVDYHQALHGHRPLWFMANSSDTEDGANCKVAIVRNDNNRAPEVFQKGPTRRGMCEVTRVPGRTNYRGPEWIASKDIPAGEEIIYFYGDMDPDNWEPANPALSQGTQHHQPAVDQPAAVNKSGPRRRQKRGERLEMTGLPDLRAPRCIMETVDGQHVSLLRVGDVVAGLEPGGLLPNKCTVARQKYDQLDTWESIGRKYSCCFNWSHPGYQNSRDIRLLVVVGIGTPAVPSLPDDDDSDDGNNPVHPRSSENAVCWPGGEGSQHAASASPCQTVRVREVRYSRLCERYYWPQADCDGIVSVHTLAPLHEVSKQQLNVLGSALTSRLEDVPTLLKMMSWINLFGTNDADTSYANVKALEEAFPPP